MTTATVATRYAPEDLLRMPDGNQYELVDGQLVERKMSIWSSHVAFIISHILFPFCRQHRLGWVFGEGMSYRCFPGAPNKVRKPDVSFIRLDRLSLAIATSEGYCPIAPDLAVEVISPHDIAYEIDIKVQEFLDAGTPLIWVVNPERRTVEIHRATGTGTILRENDEIDGEAVLPGFRCRVAEFFQPPAGVATAP